MVIDFTFCILKQIILYTKCLMNFYLKKIDTVHAPPYLAFASSLCFGVMKVSSAAVIETFSGTSGMFGAYESPVGASTTTSSGSVARGIQKISEAQGIVEGLCRHLIP